LALYLWGEVLHGFLLRKLSFLSKKPLKDDNLVAGFGFVVGCFVAVLVFALVWWWVCSCCLI